MISSKKKITSKLIIFVFSVSFTLIIGSFLYFYYSGKAYLEDSAQNEIEVFRNHFEKSSQNQIRELDNEVNGFLVGFNFTQTLNTLNQKKIKEFIGIKKTLIEEMYFINFNDSIITAAMPIKVFGGKKVVNFSTLEQKKLNYLDSLKTIYVLDENSQFGYIYENKIKNYYFYKILNNYSVLIKINGLTLFEKCIEQIYYPPNIHFAITNRDEMIEYSTNKFWIKQKINKYFNFEILDNSVHLEDKLNIVCRKWESKYLGSWLIITNDISDDYNSFYSIVNRILFYSILIYFLIAGVALIYSKRISKYLNKITKVAIAVGDGNFENKINIKREDELGLLIDSFNKMVDNLKQSYAQLNLTNKELESKISELVRTKTELTKQQKLALIGETISKISHEMQNKISGVSVWVQNLEMQSQLDDSTQMYVDEIKNSLNSFVEMLLNFKKFYRKPFIEKSEINFINLVENTLKQFMSDINAKEINIAISNTKEDLNIVADKNLIEELLVNLLVNAIYFSPQKGTIKIDIMSNENNLEFSISDEGKGIEDEIIDNIFNPFFTTKSSGSGLGLAISKNIVEAHNGEIEVCRDVKVGAKILVRLPLTI